MYQLIVYVPASHLEPVKAALFAAGAGRYENYDQCAWEIQGDGQFRPLIGSDPHLGSVDKLTKVKEYRVEMICTEKCLPGAIKALRQNHPYEEPAFLVFKCHQVAQN